MNAIPRADELRLVGCRACGLVCEAAPNEAARRACPRCGAPLVRRRAESIAQAWALLIAALIFYLPANALPVMYTRLLGRGGESTILNGVVEFWREGSWGIALVIFIASVAVPCTKFLVLGVLLTGARRGLDRARRERTRLYRLIELVGYWSMLDVIVVAVVSALVKFQALSDIEPRSGILFFGLTVILTMLAAMRFDPRLIWDGEVR